MVGLRSRYTLIGSIIIMVLFLFSGIIAYGETQLVNDEAFLFSDTEQVDLEDRTNALSDEYNMDILITTTDDAEGKSSRDYADDYFDYGGFGRGEDHDGILFLMDMDNREIYISTTGTGIAYLTDERIEDILDHAFDAGLPDGNYYGTAVAFLERTEYFLLAGIPEDQHTVEEREPNQLTLRDVIVALVGGTGVGGIFFSKVKSKYKLRDPGSSYSYKSNSGINFINNEDDLVDTRVTRRRIPRAKPKTSSSGKSGRSTVHKSSSGRKHGGGGRKF